MKKVFIANRIVNLASRSKLIFILALIGVFCNVEINLSYGQETKYGFKVSEQNDRYEIYCNSNEILNLANKELDFAHQKFQEHFEYNPPLIVFLIFDDFDSLSNFDYSIFEKEGKKFFSWTSKRARTLKLLELEGNPVLMEQLENAVQTSTDSVLKKSVKSIEESTLLDHEAGHVFFQAYVDEMIIKNGYETKNFYTNNHKIYGHRIIPDWLDEAAAIMCETADMRKVRFNYFREHISDVIPLNHLLEMEHPSMKPSDQEQDIIQTSDTIFKSQIQPSDQEKNIIKTRDTTVTKIVTKTVTVSVDISETTEDSTSIFYREVAAFLEFILAHEGKLILSKLTKSYLSEESTIEILRNFENLSNDLYKLEEEFLIWVRNQRIENE